ncbi:hypothetical protein P9112_003020 [Eukaryota sp. TZLM1-RC]
MEDLPLPNSYSLLILNSPTDQSIIDRICHGNLSYIWDNSSVVVAADGGANLILHSNSNILATHPKYPDYCIGDLDSAQTTKLSHGGTDIIQRSSQDANDCTKALTFIQSLSKSPNLVVIGVLGGRFDQVVANIAALNNAKEFEQIICFSLYNYLLLLRTGSHRVNRIPHSTNTVGLLPMTGKVSMCTRGLKWDVDGELDLNKFISSSNKVLGDYFDVEVFSELVWISLDWEYEYKV